MTCRSASIATADCSDYPRNHWQRSVYNSVWKADWRAAATCSKSSKRASHLLRGTTGLRERPAPVRPAVLSLAAAPPSTAPRTCSSSPCAQAGPGRERQRAMPSPCRCRVTLRLQGNQSIKISTQDLHQQECNSGSALALQHKQQVYAIGSTRRHRTLVRDATRPQ